MANPVQVSSMTSKTLWKGMVPKIWTRCFWWDAGQFLNQKCLGRLKFFSHQVGGIQPFPVQAACFGPGGLPILGNTNSPVLGFSLCSP